MAKRSSITQVRARRSARHPGRRHSVGGSVVQVVAEAVKESKEVAAARELMRMNECARAYHYPTQPISTTGRLERSSCTGCRRFEKAVKEFDKAVKSNSMDWQAYVLQDYTAIVSRPHV